MNKLKMLAAAAVVAVTVGVGGLAAAPSASAQSLCQQTAHEIFVADRYAQQFTQLLGPNSFWARYWTDRMNNMVLGFRLMRCGD